jgi:hypothetical protein
MAGLAAGRGWAGPWCIHVGTGAQWDLLEEQREQECSFP